MLTPDRDHRLTLGDGTELYVEERGSGPAVVLLHGGLGSGASFEALAGRLSEQFRVFTVDSRGHGRSSNPGGKLSYSGLADDVDEILTVLRLDTPVVVGWSDGGQIALELGARHPDAARALVVGGALPDFVTSGLRETHRSLLGLDAAGRPDLAALEADLGEYAEEIKALHVGGPQHWPDLVNQTAEMWVKYEGLPKPAVAGMKPPVLVLAGDRDELVPLDLSVELHRTLPSAELAVCPQADHSSPMDPVRASVFATMIADFVHRHTDT